MDIIRRSLGGLFAILGVYYCVLSVSTLAHLPGVTASWIQRSGDPDFKYDSQMFMLWIAVGAVLVGGFGCATAVKGAAAARGARDSWLLLALAAPFVHWFWFLYRIVGSGVVGRAAQASARRSDALQFGTICVAYLVMWIVMRRWVDEGQRESSHYRRGPRGSIGPVSGRSRRLRGGLDSSG